jgi:DNA polymerase-3 subunit beta
MIITATRETLLGPLTAAMPAVKKSTLPILSNMLLDAQADGLHITATDLDTQIRCMVDVTTEQLGGVTLPARKLLDIVKLAPAGSTIKLATADLGKLRVQAGPSRYTLATLPVENFPSFDPGDIMQTLELPADVLLKAFKRVSFCAAVNDVRYFLNGVAIRLLAHELETAASDGHRLAVMQTPLAEPPDVPSDRHRILPRDSVLAMMKFLADAKTGAVKLQIGDRTASITISDQQFSTRLVEGAYPNIQRVIPKDTTTHFIVPVADMLASIARAGVVREGKDNPIQVAIEQDSLTIEAANAAGDDAREVLPINLDGTPLTLGFNGSYLAESLGQVDADTAEFKLRDNSGLVLDPSEPGWLSVVMPMRL